MRAWNADPGAKYLDKEKVLKYKPRNGNNQLAMTVIGGRC
jgi:hypothetical protein